MNCSGIYQEVPGHLRPLGKNNFLPAFHDIYTTKGRDRFHWAATPLKPYKVGNICYMTYRYSVLFFLNFFLIHFSPHRKRQFLWKYPNPETVIVQCFNVSRMPNRCTSPLGKPRPIRISSPLGKPRPIRSSSRLGRVT